MVCFVYISDYSVVLSSFLMVHVSFFFNFFPFWRLSFSQFLRIYLEVTNYLFSFIWECLTFTLIFFFLAMLDLGCCTQAFCSLVSGAYSLLWRTGLSSWRLLLFQSMGSRAHGLKGCSPWPSLLPSMWNLPGPGIEPMSLALAGCLLTTRPLGKSSP